MGVVFFRPKPSLTNAFVCLFVLFADIGHENYEKGREGTLLFGYGKGLTVHPLPPKKCALLVHKLFPLFLSHPKTVLRAAPKNEREK